MESKKAAINQYEDEMITQYPVMGCCDRLWWREALMEFGLPHSVALVAWADRYGAAMQGEEALTQVAARLIEHGLPQEATLQALRDMRRLGRRLERAYAQEEMGQAPTEEEVVQHLRTFVAPIVA